ncbi:MAG: undecaprenyl-diphosphate phosphatase [Candidatus Bathyarchaeia archaeon]
MLDQLLTTVILGLIQGISEWLPISSTAHLKLAETFFNLTVTPLFNLVLHLGTLTVVVFYFRRDVKNILVALAHWDFKSESGMLIPRIAAATVPTAVIGVGYSLFLQDSFGTIPIIAATLVVGAALVFATKFSKEETEGLSYKMALLMGTAQGFAIFPGLSRSGVTISTTLLLGLKREKAFKFSFLLSIPAVVGDFAFEAYNQRGLLSTAGLGVPEVAAGFAVAMVVGYVALRLVSRVVRGRKFHYFAVYTCALGIALLVLTFLPS